MKSTAVAPTLRRTDLARSALIAVLLIWTGMLLGVSFLAIPAQFGAPSLTRPVAFDVVRQVFGAFGRMEIALALVSGALALLGRAPRLIWLLLALPGLMVAVQAGWLRPALDMRVDLILEGQTPPPASWHQIYVVLEGLKLLGLMLTAWVAHRTG